MISFVAAVAFLIVTPGPGVLTTAGVGSAYGFRAGLPYLFGIVAGGMIVQSLVASGLAAIILSIPYVRQTLLLASLAYLLYLAFRIATSGTRVAFIDTDRPLGFLNGLTLSLINPKAYAVAATLFSGFVLLPESPFMEAVLKIAIFVGIGLPIHFIWLYAGASLKRLGLSNRANRIVNIGMALAMLAVVALALYSSEI